MRLCSFLPLILSLTVCKNSDGVEFDVWNEIRREDEVICSDRMCARIYFTENSVYYYHYEDVLKPKPMLISCFMSFIPVKITEVGNGREEFTNFTTKINENTNLPTITGPKGNRSVCGKVMGFPENIEIQDQLLQDANASCIPTVSYFYNFHAYDNLGNQKGAVNIQTNIFQKDGYSVHGYFNESQYVMKGDLMINVTFKNWNWSENSTALIFRFSVTGSTQIEERDQDLTFGTGTGPRSSYDVGSGILVLSGLVNSDDRYIKILPIYIKERIYKDRNVFELVVPRFETFTTYEGMYFFLRSPKECTPTVEISL